MIVHVGAGAPIGPAQLSLIGATSRLAFYDWEANVLAPSGKPVASLLHAQDPTATAISQGAGKGPGSPGAGSMSLYGAVKLASMQAPYISKTNSRQGAEYFIFGKAGSPACTAAAHDFHVMAVVGQSCYLAGPSSTVAGVQLSLPARVPASQAATQDQVFKVNRGWVVMEAAYGFGHAPPLSDPSAQFFVLRDDVALFGSDIANPRQSTDQAGEPDLTFGFTSKGVSEFQKLTAQIAKRGSLVSGPGKTQDQHFAVSLDTVLLSVPYIDFQADPFGLSARGGADIQGGFTIGSARRLAAQLRLQTLPVNLKLISVKGRGR